MTPEPLRIVKSNTSDLGADHRYSPRPGVASPLSEPLPDSTPGASGTDRRGNASTEQDTTGSTGQPQGAIADPSRRRQPYAEEHNRSEIDTYSLMPGTENNVDDDDIASHREYTQRCLEGVISSPRRTSSIYSSHFWGTALSPSPGSMEREVMEKENERRKIMDGKGVRDDDGKPQGKENGKGEEKDTLGSSWF